MSDKEKDIPVVKELSKDFLQEVFINNPNAIDKIPVDSYKYNILFTVETSFKGKIYGLVYKFSKPEPSKMITKLSLVDHKFYKDPQFANRILSRHPRIFGSPYSDDDYELISGELAFRYLNIDLSTGPIQVRSLLEVSEEMRGQGLGSLLFESYELLARDILGRIPNLKGKAVSLIVRDNSEPKGWTQHKAQKDGFEPIDRNQSTSAFPEYRKMIRLS